MTTTVLTPSVRPGRHDLYGPVHKGLRRMWSELLIRLGSTDFNDEGCCAKVLADLRFGLKIGAAHLAHEDEHVHTALNKRVANATRRLDFQHEQHHVRFEELDNLIYAVEEMPLGTRHFVGRRLYLTFSTFVAEDFEHMHEEETINWPLMCEMFSDEELGEIEARIMASLRPELTMAFLRFMIPAMSRVEQVHVLAGMKSAAPAEAFRAVIENAVKPTMTSQDFSDLAECLQLAA